MLGRSRRRLALYHLLSNEYTDIESLSVQVAAWEEGESVTSVDESVRQRVKISLHHNHLPRLADDGILEYDTRNGDVVRADGFEDVRPTIERLRRTDESGANPRDDREPSAAADDEQLASNS